MTYKYSDILVEGTIAGTPFRKLFCYDLSNQFTIPSLKERLLYDLKVAGAPIEADCEVVLRNYQITNYERTSFNSDASKCCALGPQAPPDGSSSSLAPAPHQLFSATPCPQVPLGPSNDRGALHAIASRQLYDRLHGSGTVLPLEARIKRTYTASGMAVDAQQQPSVGAEADPISPSPPLPNRGGVESEPFDITVRDFRSRSHTVRVCGRTSVQQLKQGLATALGCSVVSHWRLLHQGRLLAEHYDLADYSITAGSVINVQMTSRTDILLQGLPSVPSTRAADAATGGRAPGGSLGGSAGSGSDGGFAAGGFGDKAVGAQMIVQVLLASGRVLQVPRMSSDEAAVFCSRVLEAEKAGDVAAPVQATVGSGPSAAGLLVGAEECLGKQAPVVKPPSRKRKGAAFGGRMKTVEEIRGVVAQKLLALLLAATAMVVAIAVL